MFSLPKNTEIEAIGYQSRSNRVGLVHSDGAIRLFDISSRQDLPHLLPALAGATALVFSPSGQHVAIRLENAARLYSFATGEFVEIPFPGQLLRLTFSPDGQWFAAASEWISDSQNHIVTHHVKVWNADSGQLHQTLDAHISAIQSIVFAPDSQHLASRDDTGQLYLWNIDSEDPVHHLSLPESSRVQWVGALFFLSNSELASGSLIYDLDTHTQAPFLHHNSSIQGLAFNHDATLLLVDEFYQPTLWRTETGEKLFSFPRQSDMARQSSALPSTIERMQDPPIHFAPASNAVILRDQVYDVTTGQLIRKLPHRPAAFADDWYFTSETLNPHVAEFRSYGTDEAIGALTSSVSHWSSAIAQSPPGNLIATAGGHFNNTFFIDRSIKLWNTADATFIAEIPNDQYRPFRLRFSPDEALLASGSDLNYGDLAVFDVKTRTRILHLRDATSPAIGFDFLPDSRTLVYGNNTGLHFWDVPGKRLVATLTNELFNISAVAVSPNGSVIAVGRLDGTILLLDAPILNHLTIDSSAGSLTLRFHAHPSIEYQLQSSADLRTWSPLANIIGSGTHFEFQLNPDSTAFYRLAPKP